MPASANSWKRVPFATGKPLTYEAHFSGAEYGNLRNGLVPQRMEDKWFIYFEAPYLYFHRSWTGRPIYRVELAVVDDGATVSEALWASEPNGVQTDDATYHARLLDFLVANLLLGQTKPFPMPLGIEEDFPGVHQHHIAGTGFAQSPAEVEEEDAVRNSRRGQHSDGTLRQDRARGVMVGLAVGDALGMPLEFLTKKAIHSRYGRRVTEYITPTLGHPCQHLTPGQYTDDTQMALALAKSILDKGEFSPHAFKRRLIEWYEGGDHRAPGNACIEAVRRLDEGVSYKESGQRDAAGCGSAMRVPPLALAYGGRELVRHSHVQSMMTHQDARASIGSILTAHIVWRLMRLSIDEFDRNALLTEMTHFATALEEKFEHRKREFSTLLTTFPELLEAPFDEGIVKIGTGGYVVQTVLAAFFGFLYSPTDFETTIVNVVNEGHDADSVGAIAGAFSGAFNGIGAIPSRWLAPLEGRDELIAVADGLLRLKATSLAESAST